MRNEESLNVTFDESVLEPKSSSSVEDDRINVLGYAHVIWIFIRLGIRGPTRVTHGNCQCENNEWRSLQYGIWSSVMSPYEDRFIDAKYTSRVYDSVTVSLFEVSQG
ncbi:hypothetical protein Tco_0410696 [Tanacetum coccineum]